MTKDLFDGEAEGMISGQADLQRDTLTDVLTRHLVGSGAFGIADLMTEQWADQGRTAPAPLPAPAEAGGGDAPPAVRDAAPAPMSMDEALRLFAPAQGRPGSIDTSRGDSPSVGTDRP